MRSHEVTFKDKTTYFNGIERFGNAETYQPGDVVAIVINNGKFDLWILDDHTESLKVLKKYYYEWEARHDFQFYLTKVKIFGIL